MHNEIIILLIGIIILLVIIIGVQGLCNMHDRRELRDKDKAIIREIRENLELRDELRRMMYTGSFS